MKSFLSHRGRKHRLGGFSLVEATFSIGLMSVGFLALAPLLAVGLKSSRQARDDRATAQIAQMLIEEAEQGAPASGTVYLDEQGETCSSTQAAFTAQSTIVFPYLGNSSLTQLTLQVVPVGAPDRSKFYAVVYPAPQ